MRLFIKTKELSPVKNIFVWVYIPQTMNGFNIFPLKSYFTKTDCKNSFDCYCNIANQYFNIKYFGTMVNILFYGN